MVKMDNQEFKQIVAELYKKKQYRPTGVFLLYDYWQRFLICQSAKNRLVWGFPQGGVELDETFFQNMKRELKEELDINADTDLDRMVFGFHYEILDTEEKRKNERSFSTGKAYFFSLAKYVGNGNFSRQEEELSNIAWLNRSEMISYLRLQRKEKADLLERALEKSIKLI